MGFQLLTDNLSEADPVVKPSRRDAASARRERLLDAACTLIFARGFEAVTIIDIGAAAGVSGPAIYRHFASKAEILAVLCSQTIDRLIEFVGPRRDDPRDELRALIAGQVRLVVRFPELVRVFEDEQRSLPDTLRRQIRLREREHAGRWVEALRRMYPAALDGANERLAYATVGLILSMPRWPRSVRSGRDLETWLIDAALRIVLPEDAA